ncbi:MAG: hypothetical protein LBQ03_02965 [Puniceicoccales bacterium]|jgi:hypothetical protein|nr:hypothetical protein [Puniceicoccales bacterium]
MIRKLLTRFCLLQFLLLGSLFGQESLFLRAKGPYKPIENDGTQLKFKVGDGESKEDYAKGKFICIANPTYDLTFKSLFTSADSRLGFGDFGDRSHANRRLMSLLNSIIYPTAANDPNCEQIIAVELQPTEILTGSKSADEGSELEKALTALRCDIVCECTIQKENQQDRETFFIYFDIEMQRAKIRKRISNFFNYRNILQQKYNTEDVRLIAFLNYRTDELVQETVSGDFTFDKEKSAFLPIGESIEDAKKRTSPVIGLQAVVTAIKNGEEVVIMPDKPLGREGKEWLKLLGVEWWAHSTGDHRYIVPKQVSCKVIGESLEVLNHKGITDDMLRQEYEKVAGALVTAAKFKEESREEGREEGRKEGREEGRKEGREEGQKEGREEGRKEGEKIGELKRELKSFMQVFIVTDQFPDYLIDECGQRSLTEGFVRQVWDNLNNVNKTEEKYITFIQELRTRNLM